MQIEKREKEGVVILDMTGALVAGESAGEVREAIQSSISTGRTQIVLNLKGVDYIDSSGLGALVMGFTAAKRAGGGVRLLDLSRRNIELIVLTKLETVFEVFNDEQSAVNSFFPDREIRKFDILTFLQQRKAE